MLLNQSGICKAVHYKSLSYRVNVVHIVHYLHAQQDTHQDPILLSLHTEWKDVDGQGGEEYIGYVLLEELNMQRPAVHTPYEALTHFSGNRIENFKTVQ